MNHAEDSLRYMRGSKKASPSATFSEIVSSTLRSHAGKFLDNIRRNNALYDELMRRNPLMYLYENLLIIDASTEELIRYAGELWAAAAAKSRKLPIGRYNQDMSSFQREAAERSPEYMREHLQRILAEIARRDALR